MNSLFEALFEYKNWMKFRIIPNTIYRILTNPGWVPFYVREELRKSKLLFEDYINPIQLFVVLSLLPWLTFNYLPTYGTSLSGSVDESTKSNRKLFFESQTDFVSSSEEQEFSHIWTVEKMKTGSGYEIIYREDHNPHSTYRFNIINHNMAQDWFYFEFKETGEYYVTVYAGKFVPYRSHSVVAEVYMSSIKVIVPVKANEPAFVSKTSLTNPDEITDNRLYKNIFTRPSKENILPFALGLLISPLLFALTTSSAGDAKLKEAFYVQCYYCSAICLVIWATFFAFYFYTDDAYFFTNQALVKLIMFLPMVLALMWFIRAQVVNISHERKTTPRQALIIVLICIALFGLAANVLFQVSVYQDSFRMFAIRFYPLMAISIIFGFAYAWYKRRGTRGAE